MKRIRITTLLAIFALVFPSTNVLADQKVNAADIINKAPKCYAVSEILNLYSTEDTDTIGNLFTNFSNSLTLIFLLSEGNAPKENVPGIMFNQIASKMRKKIYPIIADGGLANIAAFKDLYEKMECSKLVIAIPPDNIEIGE